MHRISKKHLEKIFMKALKSIRLKKASNLLLTNKYSTISNIVNQCGYSSQSSFIKYLKRFEMSPKAWKMVDIKVFKQNLQQSQKLTQSKQILMIWFQQL